MLTHTHTPHIQALVLPFNILVSKLAKDMEDRAMMVNLNYLSFLRYARHAAVTHDALAHTHAYTPLRVAILAHMHTHAHLLCVPCYP
jgi:hypothetical protein